MDEEATSKKRKKSRMGRRTTKRKKEMHPEIKESLKLSDKGSLLDDFIFIFSSPGHRPCELLSWVVVRPSVSFSHLNLLL